MTFKTHLCHQCIFSLKEKDGKEVALFLKNCAGNEVVKNLGAKRGNIAET